MLRPAASRNPVGGATAARRPATAAAEVAAAARWAGRPPRSAALSADTTPVRAAAIVVGAVLARGREEVRLRQGAAAGVVFAGRTLVCCSCTWVCPRGLRVVGEHSTRHWASSSSSTHAVHLAREPLPARCQAARTCERRETIGERAQRWADRLDPCCAERPPRGPSSAFVQAAPKGKVGS